MRIFPAILILLGLIACSPSKEVREGQRLFAGCAKGVNNRATLKAGVFVCKGGWKAVAPFGGNGRACGTCHVPGDNFGLSVARIATLPKDDPLFIHLDEDPELLRNFGLIHVIAPGGIDEFRQTPKLVHLRDLCSKKGKCDGLGLLGDRTKSLDEFTVQAIANHLSKTTARVPGVDFRVPTEAELRALTAYQLSRLVADQNERIR